MNEQDFIVEELSGTRMITVNVQILKSEFRDEDVKGKFYAHLSTYDVYGNSRDKWNTDDFDTIEKLKKAIKEAYKNDDERFKFN